MTETIVVALITALASIIGSYLANRKAIIQMQVKVDRIEKETEQQSKELQAIKLASTEHSVEMRQLSDRVNQHNNLIERTYKLERKNDVQDHEIQQLKEIVTQKTKEG